MTLTWDEGLHLAGELKLRGKTQTDVAQAMQTLEEVEGREFVAEENLVRFLRCLYPNTQWQRQVRRSGWRNRLCVSHKSLDEEPIAWDLIKIVQHFIGDTETPSPSQFTERFSYPMIVALKEVKVTPQQRLDHHRKARVKALETELPAPTRPSPKPRF